MSLEEKISSDLKAAMKAKDQVAMRTIRAIKSAILLKKTDGSGDVIDDAAEIKLLQKLVKSRTDSLAIYEEQGREDLAKIERDEIDVLKRYLPEPLSEAALEEVIEIVVTETGASSMKDMGTVMGLVTKKVEGRADGKIIAAMVRKSLSK